MLHWSRLSWSVLIMQERQAKVLHTYASFRVVQNSFTAPLLFAFHVPCEKMGFSYLYDEPSLLFFLDFDTLYQLHQRWTTTATKTLWLPAGIKNKLLRNSYHQSNPNSITCWKECKFGSLFMPVVLQMIQSIQTDVSPPKKWWRACWQPYVEWKLLLNLKFEFWILILNIWSSGSSRKRTLFCHT